MAETTALDFDRCDCDHFASVHEGDGICGYTSDCGCRGYRGSLQRIEDHLCTILDAVQRILEEKRSIASKGKA
jgi:hypothetical protein